MAAMIRVEPLTLPWIEALAEGDAVFTSRFGIAVAEGWLVFPDALPPMLDAVRSHGATRWGTHLFFDHDGTMAGFGGWNGPPIDGVAELGYAVAPSRQGRGLATAVVRILIERGLAAGVTMVLAHTLPEASPSTGVLTRCGFRQVGAVGDPDGSADGPVWRWEFPAV
jgi:ribosomal-protein-alanine N-acetyltransferase